ncbi:TRAP transporter substrate-binding protein [Rhizobium leguminosarum]|uniref:TRAP transporter substrate-binding protein n=1 Tax=Rhizobium leguminosarum TaxID=384 RepID=UPI001C97ECFF|nr:TRAP transporter substrate-binding protein [Rhizobium leguminosarum]MBY5766980.1 TRAP transporter substrate-binding protein [Rhizobium leguminosarum]
MKKTILMALALALSATVASAQEIQSRMIRFGYGLSENSNQGRAVRFFADEVGRLSDGKLKVRGFGDASLGPDVQMQNALVGGAQEMMVGSTATLVGTVKEFALWDAPFLFASAEEADAVLDGPVGQKLIDGLEAQGLVGLVYWENGFRNLTNNRGPIEKAEDLKGVKLRVMQNPVYLQMFNDAGANAVPLPFSELFTAMETGAVDGQENPYTTILSSKFFEVQKYLTISNHVYSPWIMLASKKWWDGLSADEKKILTQAAIASRDFERKDTREQSQKALEELKANGMTVSELPEAEIAKLREIAAPATKAVIDSIGQSVWDEAQAELAKARGN